MKKRGFLFVIFILLVGILTACGSDGLEGYYKMTGGLMEGTKASWFEENGGFYIIVNSDNTFMVIAKNGVTKEDSYTWDEKWFYWGSTSDKMSYTNEDGKLSMVLAKQPYECCPIFTKITSSDEIKKLDELSK